MLEAFKQAYLSGQTDKALELARQLVNTHAPSPDLLFIFAKLESEVGDKQRAKRLLEHLLGLKPQHEEARLLLGWLCNDLGDHDGAIRILRPLAKNGSAQYMLGEAYNDAGAHAAAALAYEKALQFGMPDCMPMLARAYYRAGAKDKYEALARSILQSSDDRFASSRHFTVMNLGFLLAEDKRWADLDALLLPLIEDTRVAIVARTSLAAAYMEQGNLDRAVEALPPEAVSLTNWSHTFIVGSILQFKRILHMTGARAPRRLHPYPGSDIGFTCGSLGYHGRFGHQMGEYVMLRWLADETGIPLETPEWVGQYVFELDDPQPTGRRHLVERPSTWIEEEVAAKGAQALAGFDFFSPGGHSTWKTEYTRKAREVCRIRPSWLPLLDPLVAALKSRGNAIVGIHIRLTDRVNVDTMPPYEWYLDWLRKIWPQLDKPILYIASDDLDAALGNFSEFNPLCLNDITTPMPGLEWLQDFYVLMNAHAVATSVGSFAPFACILNTVGTTFVRPSFKQQSLVPYSPLHHFMVEE